MKKITCSEICRRKLAAIKLTNYKEEQKYMKANAAVNRSVQCMRKETVCKNYSNWLEFPYFLCECTGYDPESKPNIITSLQSASLGGSRVSNGMVSRKKSSE